MPILFKIIGGIGLLCISAGIITKKRKAQDLFYMTGGVFLEAYSIYLGDVIFIVLEIIFVSAALYDFVKLSRHPARLK